MQEQGIIDDYIIVYHDATPRIAINNVSLKPLIDELGMDVQPATSVNFAVEVVSYDLNSS